MRPKTEGQCTLRRRRVGMAALGVAAIMLLSGCHGHGHYAYHRGVHGCHNYHGGYGYSGDVDLFTGLAVLFVALWAACS